MIPFATQFLLQSENIAPENEGEATVNCASVWHQFSKLFTEILSNDFI